MTQDDLLGGGSAPPAVSEYTSKQIDQMVVDMPVGDRLRLLGVPDEVYHGTKGLGSTAMKVAHKTMADFHIYDTEPREFSEATLKAFCVGSAAHTLVLEPHLFDAAYGIELDIDDFPDALRTSDEMKDVTKLLKITPMPKKKEDLKAAIQAHPDGGGYVFWEDLLAEIGTDKTLLSKGDYQDVIEMGEAVTFHAGHLFKGGEAEVSYWFKHPSGLILKARADYETNGPNGKVVTDLKTTRDDVPEYFRATVKKSYSVQDSLYRKVTQAAEMIYIGVTKTKPHHVFPVLQGDDVRQKADSDLEQVIRNLAYSYEMSDWAGYPFELLTTKLNAWETE